MPNSPLNKPAFSRARQTGGFTLVELLVVIGIIAILAGVALGPITRGITKARESAAMQTTRSIALAEFQYQNDNSVYPDGQNAQAIATSLITGGYISDPNIFYIAADGSAQKPGSLTSFEGGNGNVSFDFTGVNGANANTYQGVSSSASDLLPLVWSEGDPGCIIPTSANTGTSFTPSTGIFQKDGVAVCYHSNNAAFVSPNTQASVTWPPIGQAAFVGQAFDPASFTYVVRYGASGK